MPAAKPAKRVQRHPEMPRGVAEASLRSAGHDVRLEKPSWPALGLTKRDLLQY